MYLLFELYLSSWSHVVIIYFQNNRLSYFDCVLEVTTSWSGVHLFRPITFTTSFQFFFSFLSSLSSFLQNFSTRFIAIITNIHENFLDLIFHSERDSESYTIRTPLHFYLLFPVSSTWNSINCCSLFVGTRRRKIWKSVQSSDPQQHALLFSSAGKLVINV